MDFPRVARPISGKALSLTLMATLVATMFTSATFAAASGDDSAASAADLEPALFDDVDAEEIRLLSEEAFLEQYDKIKDPANGYFREFDGLLVPYHSVETLMVEAPDHGHQTTSEAFSYYLLLEATYGQITGEWEPFNDAWASMEEFIIPGPQDQPTNAAYDPSSPATYAPEHPSPGDYPSALDFDVPVGEDPLASELSATYGTDDIYQMHWLLDVDNVYGYGFCGDGTDNAPAYINTYQRGQQESVWQTIPHPSCETFEHGGENGFLDLFIDDESYAQQWRYTSAPDADARAVQVAYWAHTWAEEQGNAGQISDAVSQAAMLGDYLRYSMYDKYFKQIGDCVGAESCPGATGRDSAHYLLSWYSSWGGAMADAEFPWAYRISGSGIHQGYQNPLAAYALSEVDALQPASPTGAQDWATSLDTQLEFIQWLQAPEGGIAGGATNNWGGHYGEPDSSGQFNGMAYDWQPVWNDPPSNQWFGFQVWGMERIAQYYHVTGDERAGQILESWVPWAIANTDATGADFTVPATLGWSGEPGANLSVSVTGSNSDVGVAAGLAKTLLYYAAASGDADALATGEGLLASLTANTDDLGVATVETREDYSRFTDPWDPSSNTGTYVPEGWTGTTGTGDPIDSDSTFLSIRSFYEDDPDWPQVQEYLDGGDAPELTYHRFWSQVDVATAYATYAELFGEGGGEDPEAP